MKFDKFLTHLPTVACITLLVGCATAPEPAPEPAPKPEPVVAEHKPAPLVLKPDYPETYVVVKGDTLWDISERFLKDPWRWPELWQNNPEIANPHLIYPGDVLVLMYIDGRPVLQVRRGQQDGMSDTVVVTRSSTDPREVRLSPKVIVEPLSEAIPTIPVDAISPFLSRPRIISKEEYEAAPYVVSSADGHLIVATGNTAYVRGLTDELLGNYVVVRKGDEYLDPADDDIVLGYEATYIAEAKVMRFGDPATVRIHKSKRELLNGDRLFPEIEQTVNSNYMPHAPDFEVDGKIISVLDGIGNIGQYQIVVLDRGADHGLEKGHVMAINQSGRLVRDTVMGGSVELPEERAGIVMVFRTYERMSYALVMDAFRAMHVGDKIVNP